MIERTCSIEGCEKPARSMSADWCKMHYHRWYRHGSTDMRAGSTKSDVGKYRLATKPGHPVTPKCGRALEHRIVLYDAIGPGWHECHWCGTPVSWDLPSTNAHGLQVDHLNARRDDNRLDNLVPSCLMCDAPRGGQARHDLLIQQGFWSNNDTIAALRGRSRRPRIDSQTRISRGA